MHDIHNVDRSLSSLGCDGSAISFHPSFSELYSKWVIPEIYFLLKNTLSVLFTKYIICIVAEGDFCVLCVRKFMFTSRLHVLYSLTLSSVCRFKVML